MTCELDATPNSKRRSSAALHNASEFSAHLQLFLRQPSFAAEIGLLLYVIGLDQCGTDPTVHAANDRCVIPRI